MIVLLDSMNYNLMSFNKKKFVVYTKPPVLCKDPLSPKSYEENAIAQIEEIYNGYQASLQEKQEQASIQDQITNLELAIAEIYESLA